MENKRYLDKVVDYMVRNTVIKNYLWNPTLRLIDSPIPIFAPDVGEDSWGYIIPLYDYLRKQFGLTDDEVQYVFERWVGVMKEMYREDGNVDL